LRTTVLEFSDKPLDYKEIEPYVDYVKTHGILKFLNSYKRFLKRPDDILKWGERWVRLSLRDKSFQHADLETRGVAILPLRKRSIRPKDVANFDE